MADNNQLFFDGLNWDLAVNRNMSFWCTWALDEGHFLDIHNFGPIKPVQFLDITFNGTQTFAFTNAENYKGYADSVMGLITSPDGIKNLEVNYRKYSSELYAALATCDKNLTVETWQEFARIYRLFTAALMITATLGRSGIEVLTKKLEAVGVAEFDIAETIATVTYPGEHTPLFNSQLDLMQIGMKVQNKTIDEAGKKKELEGWLAKYRNIPVNFCDEPWNLTDAEGYLASYLKKDCKAEFEKANKTHEEKIKKADERLKEINNADITTFAKALAKATFLNEFRKNVFSTVSLGYRGIFTKIAAMAGSDNWRDCFFLTPDEMTDILKGKKVPIADLKAERQTVGYYITLDGTMKFLDRDTTERFASYLRGIQGKQGSAAAGASSVGENREVRGFSACRGKVQGIVKIILSSKDFHKLNPGEILVTTMTSVDFVPVMERAAAFVTNEGGITSHASIVAREMNKPCVIGTKFATQVFKDGDQVEVDAEKGTVTMIE